MEENILEVDFLGFFPDTVVVRRLDDGGTDARRYVPQDLYEDVDAANRAWQKENRKLRELVRDMWMQLLDAYGRMSELGIEVEA